MNLQSNDNRSFDDISETLTAEGERIETPRDARSTKDDMEDYVFIRPRRHRHSHSSSHSDSSTHHRHSHHKHHHKKRLKKWQKVLIGIVSGLLALVLLLVGTAVFLVLKGQSEMFSKDINIISPKSDEIEAEVQENGKYIVYDGSTYKLNENITSMLFIGVDKKNLEDEYKYGGAMGQSDALVLMAIDTDAGKIKMIPIPRDTMTEVAVYSKNGTYTGMEEMQICLAYAFGDGKETSCENTVRTVERLFYNIPVNTYYALDLDGIVYLNDALGGIDVVSPNTVEVYGNNGLAYSFEEGESYHLEGRWSEAFLRSRAHDSANASLARMERQKAYVKSFLQTGIQKTKKDLSLPLTLFNASAPYSCTNLNPAKVTYLAKEVATGNGMDFEFVSVPGSATLNKEEYAEFRIDEKKFYEMFLSVYYEKVE